MMSRTGIGDKNPFASSATTNTSDTLDIIAERNHAIELFEASNQNSIHGFHETPTLLALSMAHLRDAISTMPDDIKQDYLSASQIAPNLVQIESDPVRFLRREAFNPWAAARRLVLYWEYRHQIFKDRWLLPFNDSADSALDSADIAVLKSGWSVVVSRESQPPLVFFDDSKIVGDPIDERLRAVFYTFSLIGNYTSAQRHGVVIVHCNTKHKVLSLKSIEVFLEILYRGLPVDVSRTVIVKFQHIERGSFLDMINTKLYQTHSKLFGAEVPHTLLVPSLINTAEKLAQELAIPEAYVPEDLGGLWKYKRLMEWQRHLESLEDDPPASVSLLTDPRAGRNSDNHDRSEELSRARNALYARRAYRRRKAKEGELEQEVQRLENIQERLWEENERLRALHREARSIVNSLKTGDEEDDDFFPLDFQRG